MKEEKERIGYPFKQSEEEEVGGGERGNHIIFEGEIDMEKKYISEMCTCYHLFLLFRKRFLSFLCYYGRYRKGRYSKRQQRYRQIE